MQPIIEQHGTHFKGDLIDIPSSVQLSRREWFQVFLDRVMLFSHNFGFQRKISKTVSEWNSENNAHVDLNASFAALRKMKTTIENHYDILKAWENFHGMCVPRIDTITMITQVTTIARIQMIWNKN
eukprot:gb/GECH01008538.1/.p1 GENE.gb/GECH01008538.1/~~gb/GECH01008538.1/.p1  ORF type:complete len:126 (+),score=25.33 gb/GECH01008538.1/:1-378(+)